MKIELSEPEIIAIIEDHLRFRGILAKVTAIRPAKRGEETAIVAEADVAEPYQEGPRSLIQPPSQRGE